MAIKLEGVGEGKALMGWPLVEELFCGFPYPRAIYCAMCHVVYETAEEQRKEQKSDAIGFFCQNTMCCFITPLSRHWVSAWILQRDGRNVVDEAAGLGEDVRPGVPG